MPSLPGEGGEEGLPLTHEDNVEGITWRLPVTTKNAGGQRLDPGAEGRLLDIQDLGLLVRFPVPNCVVISLEAGYLGQEVEAPHRLSSAADQFHAHVFDPSVQVGEHEAGSSLART